MKIYTPDCDYGKTLKGRLFAEIWQKVQSEYLREFDYQAQCAYLSL